MVARAGPYLWGMIASHYYNLFKSELSPDNKKEEQEAIAPDSEMGTPLEEQKPHFVVRITKMRYLR